MQKLQELHITSVYFHTIALSSVSVLASLMMPIANEVWDDVAFFIAPLMLISGIGGLVVASALVTKKEYVHKCVGIFCMVCIMLFGFVGVKDVVTYFFF